MLGASDLVKVIVNGYCRFTLLLSQEGMKCWEPILKARHNHMRWKNSLCDILIAADDRNDIYCHGQ